MKIDGGDFFAEDKTLLVQALEESNEILREQVENLERRVRILRTTVRNLRTNLSNLRKTHEIAVANDEEFKALCQNDGELDTNPIDDGGLPEINLDGPTSLES